MRFIRGCDGDRVIVETSPQHAFVTIESRDPIRGGRNHACAMLTLTGVERLCDALAAVLAENGRPR